MKVRRSNTWLEEQSQKADRWFFRPVVTDRKNEAVGDGNGGGRRIGAIERRDKAVVENEVGRRRGVSGLLGAGGAGRRKESRQGKRRGCAEERASGELMLPPCV
ncbi:hypothetical protein [Ensifer sp. SSB1]|jgi:hypothetical protein|uniref:hypothetical protein n=1 Tax=Ensifer sp. SSB1 TaxID=2795385 RepID=UPI001A5D924A|nr:hypothetical protein [Ensifer sp. SSB1]MBK5568940.1 hypothetical protein [Ensifer sp. SSB1]